MLTQQPLHTRPVTGNSFIRQSFATDRIALVFIAVAMSYLVLGLIFGLLGGFQYLLPKFLKDALNFQKTRPLHVYLAIAWIFTAAQGGLYYYLPRVAKRPIYWQKGVLVHLILQVVTSLTIVIAFFAGYFGGREYLEFPPLLGLFIAISWLPFAINFFTTLKPRYSKAPVYYFSWTTGIIFFFITLSESYLWLFDFVNNNQVRDTTIQWKALGSMVGAWNMLVYGTAFYVMEQIKGDSKISRSPLAFFFFFLGFTNLMFNWGHHTYIVPAATWVKTVSYVISMTELLLFGQILWTFRKSLKDAQKTFHIIPNRLLSFADLWVFLNLGAAIAISVPALNYYTHGTHITVAHAMGTTIGINTMLLFASVFYILQQQKPEAYHKLKRLITAGISITNISLIFFWSSLIAAGLVKISARLNNKAFYQMMEACKPAFRLFTFSGGFILVGLVIMMIAAFRLIITKEKGEQQLTGQTSILQVESV